MVIPIRCGCGGGGEVAVGRCDSLLRGVTGQKRARGRKVSIAVSAGLPCLRQPLGQALIANGRPTRKRFERIRLPTGRHTTDGEHSCQRAVAYFSKSTEHSDDGRLISSSHTATLPTMGLAFAPNSSSDRSDKQRDRAKDAIGSMDPFTCALHTQHLHSSALLVYNSIVLERTTKANVARSPIGDGPRRCTSPVRRDLVSCQLREISLSVNGVVSQ